MTVTVYFPAVVGAVVSHEATPEASVTTLWVIPLSVMATVCPAITVPDAVLSVAERVIDAPRAALVGPV